MIEKLSKYKITSRGENYINADNNTRIINTIVVKINELVDAVNSLRDDCNLLMGYIAPENKCEPAENSQSAKIAQGFKNLNDPYAKYRKWAGKLCRFWDEDKDRAIYNILEEVIADWSYKFKTKSDYIFDHCEPVKPDDDIIYKGGDNG